MKFYNGSIWLIDATLTGTSTLGQSGPGSDGNASKLYTPHLTIDAD